MATTTLTQGIEEYESDITFGNGIDVTGTGTFSDSITGTGLLHSFGTRKIQTFVGTLKAGTDTGTAYADGDVLVELGTLDTSAPSGIVGASKFFIHRALIGITTAAGQTLVGGLSLSATSGTATNSGVSSGTEIVGAGVASFNPRISATDAVTEIDLNYGATAGLYQLFLILTLMRLLQASICMHLLPLL